MHCKGFNAQRVDFWDYFSTFEAEVPLRLHQRRNKDNSIQDQIRDGDPEDIIYRPAAYMHLYNVTVTLASPADRKDG